MIDYTTDAPELTQITFEPFPKMARLMREIIITEKIDGTNAQVIIAEDGVTIGAASRTKLIYPGKEDNAGFAGWVEANKEELRKLGPGRHFGEWWGGKIQRGYGLKEKRFSLFNVSRWADDEVRPKCCHVVPILYTGMMDTFIIDEVLKDLAKLGSQAAKGFMDPEGIVIWHTAANVGFKRTIKDDEVPKGMKNGN